ncbi:hypothetical protein CLV63_116148 [Murinocardiopsis flavida]|uniref:Uncharacterized protein n=1 Tax=Murinocardiopsis flavida TaxID=645275 RepID=A0A2P8D987_9ACTN|nr:hypothetical protein [Murinocardiopsis flavida]PSK93741.1 hypothetical protein CLV63_116148 [Murinocardiopsis flavida]
MADNVRPISSATTAKARAQAEAHRIGRWAEQIAAELKTIGAVVLACADEAERERARKAGRRAGRIIDRRVRTKILPDGRVGVWDTERGSNPLQARLDEQRANRAISEALANRPPLLSTEDPEGDGPQ